MDEGYIGLHRKLKSCWIWENPLYLKAWIDILFSANYKDKRIPFNNHVITIKRGQFITSQRKLALSWGCSVVTVRAILKMLVEDGMIEVKTDNKKTLLTVVKYELYQFSETQTITQTITPTITQGITQTITQTFHNEKGINNSEKENNDKNGNNDELTPLPPKGGTGKKTVSFDVDSILEGFNWSDEMKELVKSFFEYRKEIKKPLKSERGVKSLLKEIDENITTSGESFVDRCINKSMANGWQGVFFEQDRKQAAEKPKNDFLERLKDL